MTDPTTTTTSSISTEQIQELRDHFHVFDLNGSGWIEEDDLKRALELLGKPKDDYEVRKLLQSIDLEGDGRISFDEYTEWNRQLFIDDMKQKFEEIDLDHNGALDKNELREFANHWADYHGVTEEELDQLMYEMDINQEGTINLEEFIIGMAQNRIGQAYYVINAELYHKKLEDDFKAIDADGNGYVDKEELRLMANKISYMISEQELDDLMKEMDDDKTGKVSLQEFIAHNVRIKTRNDTSSRRKSRLSMTRRSSSAYLMNGLTHDRIEELREHFHIFDLNGSGWIEKDDLQQALAILGQPSDDDEVNKLLTAYDTNLDGRVSFDEYIAWNRQLFVDEMTTKFNEMDEDGSGTLDKVELKKIALELGFGVTEEELDDLTYEMDINQDGNIDVEEFILAMAKARAGHAYFCVNAELYQKKLEDDFNAIDLDGNGYVEKEELREMANKLAYTMNEQELDSLMNDMDDNKDGKISLEEFIAATVKIKTQRRISKLRVSMIRTVP